MLRSNPLAAVQLRYGAQLVAMGPGAFELGGATVQLASLDDLARVAEKHGRLIFWVVRTGLRLLRQHGEGCTFRQTGREAHPAGSDESELLQV
jgi:hypothetical protein